MRRIGPPRQDRSGIACLRFSCFEFNRAAIIAGDKNNNTDRAIAREGLTGPSAPPPLPPPSPRVPDNTQTRRKCARTVYTKRPNAENSRCVRFPLDKRRHDADTRERPTSSNIILQTCPRARHTFTYILERGREREREGGREGGECDTTFSFSLNYARDYPTRTNQTYRRAMPDAS